MRYLLFTTTTCPKCPTVKDYVSRLSVLEGDMVDNTSPHFGPMISKYSVSEAPTFLVLNEHGQEIFRGNEVSEIESFFKK